MRRRPRNLLHADIFRGLPLLNHCNNILSHDGTTVKKNIDMQAMSEDPTLGLNFNIFKTMLLLQQKEVDKYMSEHDKR
jgi:hypothetical protein